MKHSTATQGEAQYFNTRWEHYCQTRWGTLL